MHDEILYYDLGDGLTAKIYWREHHNRHLGSYAVVERSDGMYLRDDDWPLSWSQALWYYATTEMAGMRLLVKNPAAKPIEPEPKPKRYHVPMW